MTKTYRIIECLCLVALAAFIAVVCIAHTGGTDKDIEALAASVSEAMDENQMTRKTNADAYKAFHFDFAKTDGVAYFANDNIMDVSELLIVKLQDEDDAQELKTAIKKRVTDRQNLYKSYAPAQYSLLQNCVIEVSGNAVFYCTAKNADKLLESFKEAL
ncbi:MAG: DUF4358 domain-containing protein [Ruminococcaceae bacterium]|nr:DUF4358 domain-containing protein [Oscillospiraceae bacterium]